MSELWASIQPYLSAERVAGLARALLLLIVGLVLARLISGSLWSITHRHLPLQQAVLVRRSSFYLLLVLFLAAAFHQLGFNLGVLLGAAGVLSVAIGFASQTSASNVISGLFLIGEQSFGIGDTIQIGDTKGEVRSIDLLSVKIRTFDNVFVRIPNETLVKSEVRTLTKYPIRRVDLSIGVAYKEDIERVRAVLLDVADKNPLCLDEPRPQFFFVAFGDSAIEMQFSPWTTKQNWVEFKTQILLEIKRRLDEEGIEIPFPHRSLYMGSASEPFPVRVVEGEADEDAGPHS